MRRYLLAFCSFGAFWLCAQASAQPSHLHWVQSVAVKESARDHCEAPRFSEAELKAYFLREALRVPEEGFAQRDWAGCYAEGYAVDARGQRQLRWQLDLLGTGTITWADGRVHPFARKE